MRYLSYKKRSEDEKAVALGFFDGVHTAHRAVIERTAECAGLTPAAVTFGFSDSIKRGGVLQTEAEQEKRLRELGIQAVCRLDFSEVKDMPPEEFFRNILVEALNAKAVSCGYNFRFGKNAEGDIKTLESLCRDAGVRLLPVGEVMLDGVHVSTSEIKRLLSEGNIEKANRMLGYSYSITGKVVAGNRIGREIGFPTVNQLIPSCKAPLKKGVYASIAEVDGAQYAGVTNIGVKPTVENRSEPLAETHILGFDGDLYGKTVTVKIISFLRPEIKFSSLEELKEQISRDKTKAKEILSKREEL